MKINSKVKKTYLADKNKEKSKFKKKLKRKFLCGESGAVALSFLIMFPFILSFLALAIDGSRLIMKANRLNRVLNESALAVSASRLADKLEITDQDEINELHKTLLKDYVVVHFPDDTLVAYDVTSSTETTDSDSEESATTYYTLTAKIKVDTLLPLDDWPSFDPEILVSNSGRVKLTSTTVNVPTDFAFVLDFSGSMTNETVTLSDGSEVTRLALLKLVLADVLPAALDANEKNKITLVPYSVGVAEKLTGTNPAGGERVGCTGLNASTDETFNIDHTFWSRMAFYSEDTYQPPEYLWGDTLPEVTFKAVDGYPKEIVKLDYFRYEYYRNYVAVATGYSMDKMVSLGWCTDNQGTEYGEIVPYSCAQSYETKLTSQEGQEIVADEYENFLNNTLTYPHFRKMLDYQYADVSYIINHLFDDDSDSLVTFEMEWVPPGSQTHPGINDVHLCYHSGLSLQSWSITTRTKASNDANTKYYFPRVSLDAYLVNLTNDLTALNEVQNMNSKNGGTDSNIPLLRAAQELKKGTNKRKVIIVISDGDDNFYSLTTKMHQTYSVCSRIREGLIASSPGTEDVLFYFIATVNNMDKTMTLWSTYCTDVDLSEGETSHTMLATDYSTLTSILRLIVTEESETGSIAVD